jgi:hypothetical protein
MATTGTGTTIVFGTSGITSRFRQIAGLAREIEALDDTSLASVAFMEKVPADLADSDPIECEIYWDSTTETLPSLGVAETITITLPGGATITGSGFITRCESPTLTPNERQIANLTFVYDGKTGPAHST